jgi:hypothetical protein
LINVRWPNGSVQTLNDMTVDTEWLLVQNDEAFQLTKAKFGEFVGPVDHDRAVQE